MGAMQAAMAKAVQAICLIWRVWQCRCNGATPVSLLAHASNSDGGLGQLSSCPCPKPMFSPAIMWPLPAATWDAAKVLSVAVLLLPLSHLLFLMPGRLDTGHGPWRERTWKYTAWHNRSVCDANHTFCHSRRRFSGLCPHHLAL